MPNLAMQDVFVNVSRIPSNGDTTGKIISEAWLVDGFKEDKATLILNEDFIITSANYHSYRAGNPAMTVIDKLAGVSVLDGAGRILRREAPPQLVDLFAEALRAISQGRVMMFPQEVARQQEPGRKAADCYYFSHLEEATGTFMQYASSGFFHNQTYFTRYLHVGILPGESPNFCRVEGSWLDTVHEILFNLEIGNDSTILAAKASVFHRPDPMCRPSGRAIENLVGHRLKEIDYRTTQNLVSGPMGCLHLADITLRAAQFYNQACL